MVEEEQLGRDFLHLTSIEKYHSLSPSIDWFIGGGIKPKKNLSLVLQDLQELYSFFDKLYLFLRNNLLFKNYRLFETDFSLAYGRFAYFEEHFSSYLRGQSSHDLKIVDRCLKTIFHLMKESHEENIVDLHSIKSLVLANLQIALSRLQRVIASFAVVSKS